MYTKEVEKIIDEYGSFGVGEVESDSSPMIQGQNGNLIHLIEHFHKDYGEVNVYSEHSEYPIDIYNINYSCLDDSTKLEILNLAIKYKNLQENYE